MAKFQLADMLKDVSDLNTGREQIVYIDPDKLLPDPDNFYSLEGLEDLASNIELVGLQQPLRVRPNADDSYTIVSGHRRRAAIQMIRDGGSDQFTNGVPCIVELQESGSKAWQELRLIFANSATRVMTPADLSKQAERVTELLYQLKKEGVEFPGRMRAHVAAACQVSESKLARLNAIRNAHEYVVYAFDEGKINESVAYELSKIPKDLQKLFVVNRHHQMKRFDILTAKEIQAFDQLRKKLTFLRCEMCNIKGATCFYATQRIEFALNRLDLIDPIPACVRGYCCKSCRSLMRCEDRCEKCDHLVREKKDAQEASWQRRQEERVAEQMAIDLEKKEILKIANETWARISNAAAASGADVRRAFSPIVECESDLDFIEDAAADPSADTTMWILNVLEKHLTTIADGLQCSTDYLLRRTDYPEMYGGSAMSLDTVTWQAGTPPSDGLYYVNPDFTGPMVMKWSAEKQLYRYPSTGGEVPVKHIVGWWPVPDDAED